jgi:hypothetical protein
MLTEMVEVLLEVGVNVDVLERMPGAGAGAGAGGYGV